VSTAAWEWGWHGNGGFLVLLGFSSGGFCKELLGTSAQVKWSNQNGAGWWPDWQTGLEGRCVRGAR